MSKEIADRFRAMADLIEKNDDSTFAGCFVIAFPSGEVKEGMSLGHADPVQFFATVKSICDMAVQEMHANVTQGQYRSRTM